MPANSYSNDSKQSTTIAQALQTATHQGLERLDAQGLLLHTLGRSPHDRAWLLGHDTDPLEANALARFQQLCARRLDNAPMGYLTGWQEFFGLPLQVDKRVLVPRPDTETLVEWALQAIVGLQAPQILDLGTGSGAIALALAHARPDAAVHAVDASTDALAVARGNAQRLGLPVVFSQGSWLTGHSGRYALIASNPPYIPQHDPHLTALVHEPLQALAAGADGLDDIRAIVSQAPAHLAPGGWLLLEHGYDQAAAVRALLQAQGFTAVQSRRDMAGIERCSGGQWPTVK
jgi:release factor glutamine methyltransferase